VVIKRFLNQRQVARQSAQDSSDASLVQTSSIGDLREREPFAFQMQDRPMIRGTKIEHPFPKIIRLRHLARSRMPRIGDQIKTRIRRRRRFDRSRILTNPRYQSPTRDRRQKRFQVLFIVDLPAIATELTNDLDPNGLDDIGGIELATNLFG